MSSWSQRRKALYAIVIAVIVIGAVIVPAFLILYHPPTCTDGVWNGDEKGTDCGGSCERLCQSDFLSPSLAWTRFEEVAPGLYNVAAYIVNPNTEGEAWGVPYHISLYDDRGVPITDDYGTVTLPPHRNTIAFRGAVDVGARVPAKALFEFKAAPDWHKKKDPLSALVIADKKYTDEDNGSSLIVTLKNPGIERIGPFAVYAILYDKDGNALGFSRTYVDEIRGQGSALAPFTWPVNRQGKVISIEVLPVQE